MTDKQTTGSQGTLYGTLLIIAAIIIWLFAGSGIGSMIAFAIGLVGGGVVVKTT